MGISYSTYSNSLNTYNTEDAIKIIISIRDLKTNFLNYKFKPLEILNKKPESLDKSYQQTTLNPNITYYSITLTPKTTLNPTTSLSNIISTPINTYYNTTLD